MEIRLSQFFIERLHAIHPRFDECRTTSPPMVFASNGTVVEKAVADCWAKGTFDNPVESLEHHYFKHACGRTLREYTYEAARFFQKYHHEAQWGRWNPRWPEAFQLKKGPCGGYFTPGGRILSYWGFDEQGDGTL